MNRPGTEKNFADIEEGATGAVAASRPPIDGLIGEGGIGQPKGMTP